MASSRRVPARSAHRRAATALALAAGGGALVLGGASPALAHDGLVGSSPADGATVTGAPREVELDFTGEPLPLGTLVTVIGPDAEVSSGAAEIRGTTVTQAVVPDAPPGNYRVEWRSTASDGHSLSGTFGFTVTAPSGAAAGGPATSPDMTDATSTSTTTDRGIAPVWLAAGAVVLVGLGTIVASRLRRRS